MRATSYHLDGSVSDGRPDAMVANSVLDLGIEPTTELDHNGFWVGVAGFRDEVLELVYVVHPEDGFSGSRRRIRDGLLPTNPRARGLNSFLNSSRKSSSPRTWATNVLGEFFPSEYASRPLSSSSGFHIGHGPHNFGFLVTEFFGTKTDVGLAGVQKG